MINVISIILMLDRAKLFFDIQRVIPYKAL